MIDVLFQNLERGSGQNAASIPSIEILPCMHIDLWPGNKNGAMLGIIKTKNFRDWVKLYLTDHSKSFSEKVTNTSHGRKYAFQITGFFPGDTEELRQLLGITEWVKFCVRVRDSHGIIRIVGNKFYGLEMDYDSIIAAEMAGVRGTPISFSGDLSESSAIAYN